MARVWVEQHSDGTGDTRTRCSCGYRSCWCDYDDALLIGVRHIQRAHTNEGSNLDPSPRRPSLEAVAAKFWGDWWPKSA